MCWMVDHCCIDCHGQEVQHFDSICTMYVNYIKKFPQPTIVFDGYEAGPSTKDTTHLRRSGDVVGAKVNFDGSTPVASKKEHFLAHANNKQRFVDMLSQKLDAAGCHVLQAVVMLMFSLPIQQWPEQPRAQPQWLEKTLIFWFC